MRSKYWIFFFLLLSIGVVSVKAKSATVQYFERIYSNRISDEKVYSGQLGYIMVDGKIVYCMEPYLIVGKEYEVNNDYLNQFSDEDLEYFELVAGYAKNHITNDNPYYYMAAQELIWERMIGDKVYWTSEKNGTIEIDVEPYKQEIEAFIQNYYLQPSFIGTKVYEPFFTTYILEDANNILHHYEVVSNPNTKSQAWVSENELYVKILSSEEEEIRLVRKEKEGISTYYHSDTNQDLVDLSGTVMKEFSVKVQASNEYKADVMIQFFDEEFKTLINGGIQFKIHNLDTDEYSNTYVTYNGEFQSSNLKCGHYEIVLLEVPKNYLIQPINSFTIWEDSTTHSYQFSYYLKKGLGKLIVNNFMDQLNFKLYASENIYNIQNNIIYKKNELIAEKDLLLNENETILLPYGTYYLLDHTSKKYEFKLDYKDPFTEYVEYTIDIYPEKNDVLSEEPSKDDMSSGNFDSDEKENISDESDDIIKEEFIEEGMSVLPNTYNYIGVIKFVLLFLSVISITKLKYV